MAATDTNSEDSTSGTTATTDLETTLDDPSTSIDPDGTTTSSETSDPVCGDGMVEGAEECDEAGESPSCDADCTIPMCGDGLLNAAAGEECDGTDFGDTTCQSEGFASGELACDEQCAVDTSGCSLLPAAPVLELSFSAVKRFDFGWAETEGAEHYRLEQSVAPGEPFEPLGPDLEQLSVSWTMPLHGRYTASYRLQACNGEGCTESAVVDVTGTLAEAIGYFKASNTGSSDVFGDEVTISGDGRTLAVAAPSEDSNATEIDGDPNDRGLNNGAVYVFVLDEHGVWTQQAYVKASDNADGDDFGRSLSLSSDGRTLAVGSSKYNDNLGSSGYAYVFTRDNAGTWAEQAQLQPSHGASLFGVSLVLSGDGNTLAAGAIFDSSGATGIDGDPDENPMQAAGAVFVFTRNGAGAWSQQAYVKASNTGAYDEFGSSVALSGNGNTLAVGADRERSNAAGVDGDQSDDSLDNAGAVYVFERDGAGVWAQQAYVKASNPDWEDHFGYTVALSVDGDTLAVGAPEEDSNAVGIDGEQANEQVLDAGAVYVFTRDGVGAWSQQAYVKASNTAATGSVVGEWFGWDVALSGSGDALVVGARNEDSVAIGVDGEQNSHEDVGTGAVYTFVRDDAGTWAQQAYLKASDPDDGDTYLGYSVDITDDGLTVVAGAPYEDSDATGIDGDPGNNTLSVSGAVYLY